MNERGRIGQSLYLCTTHWCHGCRLRTLFTAPLLRPRATFPSMIGGDDPLHTITFSSPTSHHYWVQDLVSIGPVLAGLRYSW